MEETGRQASSHFSQGNVQPGSHARAAGAETKCCRKCWSHKHKKQEPEVPPVRPAASLSLMASRARSERHSRPLSLKDSWPLACRCWLPEIFFACKQSRVLIILHTWERYSHFFFSLLFPEFNKGQRFHKPSDSTRFPPSSCFSTLWP